jgi:hypothetical protein
MKKKLLEQLNTRIEKFSVEDKFLIYNGYTNLQNKHYTDYKKAYEIAKQLYIQTKSKLYRDYIVMHDKDEIKNNFDYICSEQYYNDLKFDKIDIGYSKDILKNNCSKYKKDYDFQKTKIEVEEIFKNEGLESLSNFSNMKNKNSIEAETEINKILKISDYFNYLKIYYFLNLKDKNNENFNRTDELEEILKKELCKNNREESRNYIKELMMIYANKSETFKEKMIDKKME